jgi:hypothetical protein
MMLFYNLRPLLIFEQCLQRVFLILAYLTLNRSSISWEHLEETIRHLLSFLLFVVIIRTVSFAAFSSLRNSALRGFVTVWMVFKFFPTVAGAATVFQFAAVLICFRVFLSFPTCALCVRILKRIGTASVVLPVMGVDTEVSLMVLVTKRTPHSFKVKHVEVCVTIHFFKYVHGQFIFMMCKSTDFPILTLVNFVRVS